VGQVGDEGLPRDGSPRCEPVIRANAPAGRLTMSIARISGGRGQSETPFLDPLIRQRSEHVYVLASTLPDAIRTKYAIQADVEVFAGLRLGPGTLYGAIGRLERDGQISPVATHNERRNVYRLTPKGRSALSHQLDVLRRVVVRAALT